MDWLLSQTTKLDSDRKNLLPWYLLLTVDVEEEMKLDNLEKKINTLEKTLEDFQEDTMKKLSKRFKKLSEHFLQSSPTNRKRNSNA